MLKFQLALGGASLLKQRQLTNVCFVSLCKLCTPSNVQEPRDYGHLRKKKAEEFFSRADPETIERMQKLETDIQILRDAGFQVPEEISTVDWYNLLAYSSSYKLLKKRCKYLYLNEKVRQNKKERRAEAVSKEDGDPRIFTGGPYYYFGKSHDKYFYGIQQLLHGQHFIIDLDVDCSVREENVSRQQLDWCCSINQKHPQGFHLHFTSVNKHSQMYMQYQKGLFDNYCCDFHEKPFWELFPLEQLIYLTPTAPPLEEYDGSKIYVMSGDVNFSDGSIRQKPKAKRLGIPAYSLPITNFGKLQKDAKRLPLMWTLEIMLNVNLNHDWRKAFKETFPLRQFLVYSDDFLRNRRKRKWKAYNSF